MKYFFIGIGGVGMNGLALFLKARGHEIWGSDRSFDQENQNHKTKEALESVGIRIVPQDGNHLPHNLDGVIFSSAVEPQNKDFRAAQKLQISLHSRAELLSQFFNSTGGIAVTGTSGKTTITGMIAQILEVASINYSLICGGKIRDLIPSQPATNWRLGIDGTMLIEADESDGSLVLYHPRISLISNISKDHKDPADLLKLFQQLADQTQETIVINQDCPLTRKIQFKKQHKILFGLSQAEKIQLSQGGSSFEIHQKKIHLQVPGLHNIANALAAIAVSEALQIEWESVVEGLQAFGGIERRLEHLGSAQGIHVYDDYSHNPAKIHAALTALKAFSPRIRVIFQPHGFGPLKHHWDDLIQTFKSTIHAQDNLVILPIFDAGGTADRSISSEDFVRELAQFNIAAEYEKDRQSLIHQIVQQTQSGDSIVVMGARDHTLTQLACDILRSLEPSF